MTQEIEPALIYCPFPSQESAKLAVKQLLEERLIACANLLPPMVSLFHWEGNIEESAEIASLLKTSEKLLDQTIARLAQLHPYKEPVILGWMVDATPLATRKWLAGALN